MIFFYNPEPLDEYEPTLVAVDADSVDDAADVAGTYKKLIYFEATLMPPIFDLIETIIRTSVLSREEVAKILYGLETFGKEKT